MWKNLEGAISTYGDAERWGSPSGFWGVQFRDYCVVVQTENYLPIKIYGFFLSPAYYLVSDCLKIIEEALGFNDNQLLGFDFQSNYDGLNLIETWPLEAQSLVKPFVDYAEEKSIAVYLEKIDYA